MLALFLITLGVYLAVLGATISDLAVKADQHLRLPNRILILANVIGGPLLAFGAVVAQVVVWMS